MKPKEIIFLSAFIHWIRSLFYERKWVKEENPFPESFTQEVIEDWEPNPSLLFNVCKKTLLLRPEGEKDITSVPLFHFTNMQCNVIE